MKFKEVAHLYIGCQIKKIKATWIDEKTFEYPLHGVSKSDTDHVFIHCLRNGAEIFSTILIDNYKPILRKTDSLNELEDRQACTIKQLKGGIVGAAESIVYLTSIHIDCFGLIESGEAIDASTLNPNPYQN